MSCAVFAVNNNSPMFRYYIDFQPKHELFSLLDCQPEENALTNVYQIKLSIKQLSIKQLGAISHSAVTASINKNIFHIELL